MTKGERQRKAIAPTPPQCGASALAELGQARSIEVRGIYPSRSIPLAAGDNFDPDHRRSPLTPIFLKKPRSYLLLGRENSEAVAPRQG